ncbi:MAG: chemotaxis-specific protein-glutamate methyltransferase CheB [Anaerolineae bacterium]|nr:chemotaxis-specific protein-glutamate methyltransferase CheB [Anaerolineae bacterium]
MNKAPLRVLIADDSATVRHFLASLIADTPDMTVVGEAKDGEEAILLAQRLHPDIISMDISMPRLDGLAATRYLMQHLPLPIVIVSAQLDKREDVDLAFMALQAGALAVLDTPPGYQHAEFQTRRLHFLTTLRAMAGVTVVRRWFDTDPLTADSRGTVELTPLPGALPGVVAIGASAGGPMALHKVLNRLPSDFPVPVAIVQHMADGFVDGLIRWLDGCTPLAVTQAEQGQLVRAGQVVVAGGGAHLTLRRAAGGGARVVLDYEFGSSPYLPSVDALFTSVATHFGPRAVGVLLTGMGADGADGLLKMREAGAHTIAQDEATCLVYGMPGAAVARGAAMDVLPITQIVPALLELVQEGV